MGGWGDVVGGAVREPPLRGRMLWEVGITPIQAFPYRGDKG